MGKRVGIFLLFIVVFGFLFGWAATGNFLGDLFAGIVQTARAFGHSVQNGA
jgi:hypothetical protein